MKTRSERWRRIGNAIVFLLISVVLLYPLVDAGQRSTTERTLRIIGGSVLLLLAALSLLYRPGRRRDRS